MEQNSNNYQVVAVAADFAYDLTLVPQGEPQLNGLAGFSVKSTDSRHASYYYSRPQLKVSGTVTLERRTQPVTGIAWLDHEWSSELLPEAAQGWDWISVNFHEGSSLMAFQLRDPKSKPLHTAATFRQAGKIAETMTAEAVEFEALRHWRSDRTGITYPVEWRIRVALRHFHLHPLIDDQELDSRLTVGTIYWEGAIRVAENGQEVGRGYLEMTGYGGKIRLG
jgi:predicted secreted hydrolase